MGTRAGAAGSDRRQVYAELTPQGRTRIDAIFEEHIALEQRMLRASASARPPS